MTSTTNQKKKQQKKTAWHTNFPIPLSKNPKPFHEKEYMRTMKLCIILYLVLETCIQKSLGNAPRLPVCACAFMGHEEL